MNFNHFPEYLDFLNNIRIPPANFGVKRSDMPQIGDVGEFCSWMADQGVTTTDQQIPMKSIRLGQNEVSKDKITSMALSSNSDTSKPIVVSNDNYILDGTHRFVMYSNLPVASEHMNVVVCDLPFTQLLPLAQSYPGATFEDVSGNPV